MRKTWTLIGILFTVAACDSHDPILPGVRSDIFASSDLNVLNTNVPKAPQNITTPAANDCPYTQKSDNTIWDGDKKVFSGFATNNCVSGERTPTCADGAVYAGLSTGELVKFNPKTRAIIWIADVYKLNNMTGGASVVDIIVPAHIHGGAVYVGGLGDAFCRINDKTGERVWCVDIGVANDFIIAGDVTYVLDTDNYLNAIRTRDGAIYWRTAVRDAKTPQYENKTVIVGREKIDATTGQIIK